MFSIVDLNFKNMFMHVRICAPSKLLLSGIMTVIVSYVHILLLVSNYLNLNNLRLKEMYKNNYKL